jgi:hypothetical protein
MKIKLLYLFLFVAFSITPSHAMSFRVVQIDTKTHCGEVCPLGIQAEGSIGKDTATEFLEFVNNLPRSKHLKPIVFMNSPGGVLEGSMKLGFVFRQLKMTVAVALAEKTGAGLFAPAQCHSACVYALMGGKKRVVPPSSKIGVHAIFTNKFEFDPLHAEPPFRKISAPTNVNDVARKYTKYMGVSSQLVNLAETVSPNSISILTPAQVSKFKLGVAALK